MALRVQGISSPLCRERSTKLNTYSNFFASVPISTEVSIPILFSCNHFGHKYQQKKTIFSRQLIGGAVNYSICCFLTK